MASLPDHAASNQFSTLPEAVPEAIPEPAIMHHHDKATPSQTVAQWSEGGQASRSPWWKRPKVLLIVLGAVVLVMGAIIGAVVGVLVSREKSSSGPSATSTTTVSPTPEPVSVCRGTVCPSMIAIADDSTPSSPPNSKLFFALGRDKAIWTRRGDGSTWEDDWTSLGGTFLSQPAAVTFTGTQTNVFAVDTNQAMQTKALKNGVWDQTWLNLAGGITAPPSVCSSATGSLDAWVRGTDGSLFHMNFNQSSGVYTPWLSEQGFLSSAPVASCAGNNRIDVVLYGGYGPPFDLFVKRWDGAAFSASTYFEEGGSFVGDPTAVSLGSDRTDYFGVGADKAMYHKSWTAASGFGPLENIGGAFQSAPYAVAVGADRVDVLAVGTDDRLKHNALVGSAWGASWDDLGGSFNSAPAAFATSAGKVTVYGLANNGSLFHGSWTIGSGYAWTDGTGWVTDGGNMSTTWFRKAIS